MVLIRGTPMVGAQDMLPGRALVAQQCAFTVKSPWRVNGPITCQRAVREIGVFRLHVTHVRDIANTVAQIGPARGRAGQPPCMMFWW